MPGKDRIGVALVGAGWIGRVHAQQYRRAAELLAPEGIELALVTVVDEDAERADRLRTELGFARAEGDWRAVLGDAEVDLVDVCVPNHLHAEIAVPAAEAGKHLFCEKPLATGAEDARRMRDAAERAGVVAMVNFNYRRAPALAHARTLLGDGPLGRPHSFRGSFTQDVGSDLSRPAAWRLSAETAGAGSIATMGSHVLDMARYLVGDPTALVATLSTHVSERPGLDGQPVPVDVDDSAALLLRFEGGALGSVYASWMAPGRKHHFELEVNAEHGSLAFNSERLNELRVCEGATGAFTTILTGAEHPFLPLLGLNAGMTLGLWDTVLFQVHDLVRAIARGEVVQPNFDDGYRVDRLIAAALESRDGNGWIAL